MSTACTGDKFILPAFTFNYGVGLDDDSPVATIILFASGDDGTNAWPAILLLPQGAKLDTTDGAHRRGQIEEILNSPKVAEDQKEALKRNAVDVKIVVLMDVDCIVSGDVAPVAEVAGDVGICAIARSMEGRKGTRHWLAFETSSRVIVFNPTDAARSFAQRWAAKIAASDFSHDEWRCRGRSCRPRTCASTTSTSAIPDAR
jgi:hypothetical protein